MLELYAVTLAACLVATVTDTIERRILNALTFPMMALGIAIHAIWDPIGAGRWAGLLGLVALGIPFFVLFAFKVVGAGDVKLLMGVGALMGLPSTLPVGIVVLVMAGLVSLIAMLGTNRLGRIGQIFRYGLFRVTGRGDITSSPKPYKIPMGLAILLGVGSYIAVKTLAMGS